MAKEIAFKKPVARSVAYPAFTIAYAVDFTTSVYSNFGISTFNSRETIAEVLKKSAEYLKQPISTCVQYGLLEMKSKVGYRPTKRFMELYRQDDPQILKNAQIECLKEPKLYSTLLETYKNDIVPSLPVLTNALFKKHGIVETVAEKAAGVFLQNLEDFELISPERKLKNFDMEEQIDYSRDESIKIEEVKENVSDPVERYDNQFADKDSKFIIEVPLKDNRKARLLCPIDLDNKDLKKIIKVINSYIEDEE